MFKKILLPTDGSEGALRAADTGIALAERLGACVYGFHVVAPYPTNAYVAEVIQLSEKAYTEEAVSDAKRFLGDIRERANAAGVPYEESYEFGHHAHAAIIHTAATQQCDLIVMASHGRRGLDRLLLGSDTHKVILNGDVPVLVCH